MWPDPQETFMILTISSPTMEIAQTLRIAMDEGEIIALEQRLYELGVLSEKQLDDAFVYALQNASADVVGVLLSHGARLKSVSMSRYELRRRGDPAIYQKLIEHGWDMNSNEFGDPAIMSAIPDNERLLRWFLNNGADPNMINRRLPNFASNEIMTPLAYAAGVPETFGLEILLSHGASMDNDALFRAIGARGQLEHSRVPHLKILLENGADVNCRSRRHGTPLQYAVYRGREDIVQFLLEHGADPTIPMVKKTPAEYAKEQGRTDIHDIIVRAIQNGHSTQV